MKKEYEALKRQVSRKKGFGPEMHGLLFDVIGAAGRALGDCEQVELPTPLEGKTYHKLVAKNGYESRPINSTLASESLEESGKVFRELLLGRRKDFTAEQITRSAYTVGISCCAGIDVTKRSDRKTQGSLFEWICAMLMEGVLGVRPERALEVLNLDLRGKLPTDLVFDLGIEKPKFHIPVKTSTRERIIQVWAHQRMLDGVYGTGRFLAMPIILTETRLEAKTQKVTEICLPWQWRLYQMHIATLWHVCYFDAPSEYLKLNHVFPPIRVVTIGELLQVGGKMDELLAEHRL